MAFMSNAHKGTILQMASGTAGNAYLVDVRPIFRGNPTSLRLLVLVRRRISSRMHGRKMHSYDANIKLCYSKKPKKAFEVLRGQVKVTRNRGRHSLSLAKWTGDYHSRLVRDPSDTLDPSDPRFDPQHATEIKAAEAKRLFYAFGLLNRGFKDENRLSNQNNLFQKM